MGGKQVGAIDKAVATRVRTHRKALGLSQTDLAKELGVTFQQVQKYENGTNRIGAGRLYEMADILQVPIYALYPEREANATVEDASDRDRAMQKISQMIASADGWRFALAFSKITDPKVRKNIIALAEQLSENAE
jgi:transcriptional regulator with XRE-family HTH domain